MKKIIYLLGTLLLITLTNGYALGLNSGPYFGGQIGWGRIDEGKGYKSGTTKKELGNFAAWRAYAGYNLVPFLSFEGGYSYYPKNKYDTTENKSYTIDLVGKIIIPLRPATPFSLYGKGGYAYVNTEIEGSTTTALRPTYGAGIIFNFTENIAVDASWTSVLGKTSSKIPTNRRVPNCNMFTLGLSYKVTGIF